MPGYVVHIAIAQEYLKKHNMKYSKDFIMGSVAPDFTNDKSKTHYGKSPAYTNLKNFLLKNNIDTDYKKGLFLHLVTDYLFYNKYITKVEKPQIYNDYDYTNKEIIEKALEIMNINSVDIFSVQIEECKLSIMTKEKINNKILEQLHHELI